MEFHQSPHLFDSAEVQRLLKQSYWAPERPLDVVARSMEHSLCFGFLDANGRLAAFARVVTDYTLFAYLCDVIVDEPYRGDSLGKQLMDAVMAHPDLQNLRHFMLGIWKKE